MVSEGHRLGRLQVREPGHDVGSMGFRLFRQGLHQLTQLVVERIERVAHPQAEIGRHLVIARARRVQASGSRADQLGKARLDVHVDVFKRAGKLEFAAFDL